MSKNFIIVEFLPEKTVEVVPASWVEETVNGLFCYWPSNNFRRRIIGREKPDKSWTQYRVKVLKKTATYEEAVKFMKLMDDTSNYDTDHLRDRESKRRRKMPKKLSEEAMLIKLEQTIENQNEILQLLRSMHSENGADADDFILRKPCTSREALKELCTTLEDVESQKKMEGESQD
ncbi:hypothetical protein ABVT39_021741 [Epinephelus coioides]